MRRAGAALALLAALGLAWWGYAGYKKRELQGAVVALVTEATARVHEVLQARSSPAAELERLEGHLKALTAAAQRLAGLEGWRLPLLASAAQQYVDEAQALLRRQLALQRGADAVLADINALRLHLQGARGRGGEWIRDAVTLKQQLERDFFDYRLAEGGMRKSLRALPEARDQLAPLVAPAPLVENRVLANARARLDQSSAQLARQVEAAGQLPAAR